MSTISDSSVTRITVVELTTSDLLGQATWRSSDRTSRRNWPGRKGSRLGGRRGAGAVRRGAASPSGS